VDIALRRREEGGAEPDEDEVGQERADERNEACGQKSSPPWLLMIRVKVNLDEDKEFSDRHRLASLGRLALHGLLSI
jgi:hypothetical protein